VFLGLDFSLKSIKLETVVLLKFVSDFPMLDFICFDYFLVYNQETTALPTSVQHICNKIGGWIPSSCDDLLQIVLLS
jgi:hypothetical protein